MKPRRRVDRTELRDLILAEAHRHMGEVGFARFSAREVAKRIGYSIGTIYNVFGGLDALFIAVNTTTFTLWTAVVERALADHPEDPLEALVDAYFSFASDNRNLWNAIYDHHLPEGMAIEGVDAAERGRLTLMVEDAVRMRLDATRASQAPAITRSLIAIAHGHCSLAIGGSYALMGGEDARRDALHRIREIVGNHGEGRP